MSSFFDRLSSFFRSGPRLNPVELQAVFRAHYKDFRALLTANNNALELMAELEEALQAGHSFGMAFVRGHCTALSVNLYKMIQHLVRLSEGRYGELEQPFLAISRKIERTVASRPVLRKGVPVLFMRDVNIDKVDQVGEKMAHLGEIRNRVGLRTPDGFVVTASAAQDFIEQNNLQTEIDRRLKGLEIDNLEALYSVSSGIQALITSAPLPQELERALHSCYFQLAGSAGATMLVALRSSALGEDQSNSSFAGQYRTQLNVDHECLGQVYKEIVASKYRSQAIVYRLQRGFRHQDVHMCVGCLRMVDAVISGVLYSRSPENPRGGYVVIQAAPGLACTVVDGSSASEQLRVSRKPPFDILDRQLPEPAKEDGGPSALTAVQVAELAETAVRLEEYFGAPQDIEWSYDRDGFCYVLQSRPLKSDAVEQSVDGEMRMVPESLGLAPPLLAGGVCASRGVGCGQVCVVRSSLDLLRFPQGAVLVVETPYPEWASLLNRAAAVISESGQMAAHLATVAREFGVPALFGLSQAVQSLQHHDLITVDATACKVYEGRVEPLLALALPKPNLMAGSPVYRILQEVMQLITPLNLTDPASPFFNPQSCQTLHDITRFCHEKAMVEMFSFGERYGFDDRAAKQLVVDAPSQWWVIDLDDGLSEDFSPENRYVELGKVVSVPMLAIWQGMVAYPWGGPPPVSLRGFGSIIFQSTRNTGIDPAVRSTLTGKNYFLISRNFCNLSVRLGYHYAIVEAYLSDLRTESYVSFSFKGGAADDRRKAARIALLADILVRFAFRVERKGDALKARVEKRSPQFLAERLKILGYLVVHARQIDMVMDNHQTICQYREKFLTEINNLLVKREDTNS